MFVLPDSLRFDTPFFDLAISSMWLAVKQDMYEYDTLYILLAVINTRSLFKCNTTPTFFP
jgi:hypothetical protein